MTDKITPAVSQTSAVDGCQELCRSYRRRRDTVTTDEIRAELAWLLHDWAHPDEAPNHDMHLTEYRAWEVRARGILSLIADKVYDAGWGEAAQLLAGKFYDDEIRGESNHAD